MALVFISAPVVKAVQETRPAQRWPEAKTIYGQDACGRCKREPPLLPATLCANCQRELRASGQL